MGKDCNKIRSIIGGICIQTKLKMEELGEIISEKLLGLAKFGGLNDEIYEEIPAIYVDDGILGMGIVLSDTGDNVYCLDINNDFFVDDNKAIGINLSSYLYELCKEKIESEEIHILSEEEIEELNEEYEKED